MMQVTEDLMDSFNYVAGIVPVLSAYIQKVIRYYNIHSYIILITFLLAYKWDWCRTEAFCTCKRHFDWAG